MLDTKPPKLYYAKIISDEIIVYLLAVKVQIFNTGFHIECDTVVLTKINRKSLFTKYYVTNSVPSTIHSLKITLDLVPLIQDLDANALS